MMESSRDQARHRTAASSSLASTVTEQYELPVAWGCRSEWLGLIAHCPLHHVLDCDPAILVRLLSERGRGTSICYQPICRRRGGYVLPRQ